MTKKLPNIAIVGNAPHDKYNLLNEMLGEEELADICSITLYGADGQPEQEALNDAIEDWRDGKVHGIVCLPFGNAPIDVLKQCIGQEAQDAMTLYVNDSMKMASITGDVEVEDVEAHITKEIVMERAIQVADILKRDYLILNPRIAIASAGKKHIDAEADNGLDIVTSAVEELAKNGTQAFGAVDGAAFFETETYQAYDAFIEIYDAQCMAAFENITESKKLIVVTAVDMPIVSTGYENTLQAVFMAIDIARYRKEYDIPFDNPLTKIYRERREDGERSRFSVKKKGFNPAEHRRENANYTTSTPPNEEMQA